MNTLTRTSYDTLLAQAKEKADRVDQPVAIVVWDIQEEGHAKFDLVVCRKGFAGAAAVGEFVEARITGAAEYDLIGEVVA